MVYRERMSFTCILYPKFKIPCPQNSNFFILELLPFLLCVLLISTPTQLMAQTWPPTSEYPQFYQVSNLPNTTNWPVINVTNSSQMSSIGCTAISNADLGDGASDEAPEIHCAINNNNSGGGRIVHLPAGTYNCRGTNGGQGGACINFQSSRVLLRGAGAGQTIFKVARPSSLAFRWFFDTHRNGLRGSPVAWTGRYSKGETLFNVASAGSFTVGQWAVMKAAADPNYDVDGFPHHAAKVVCANGQGGGCSAGQIRLDRPLRIAYTSGGQEATPWNPQTVGIESMTFRHEDPAHANLHHRSGGVYRNVAESWIRGVEFAEAHSIALQLGRSLDTPVARVLVEGNEFGLLARRLPWQKGSVKVATAIDLEFVNNVFSHAHVAFLAASTSSGVVVAYNRFLRPSYNGPLGDYRWCERSFFSHGRGAGDDTSGGGKPLDTLVEGNDFDCGMQWDGQQGPGGHSLVFYRNRGRFISSDYSPPYPPDPAVGNNNTGNADGAINFHYDFFEAFWTPTSFNREFRIWNNNLSQVGLYLRQNTNVPGSGINAMQQNMFVEYNVIRTQDGCSVEPPLSVAGCGSQDRHSRVIAAGIGPSSGTVWNNNPTGADSAPASWSGVNFRGSLVYNSRPSWWCNQSGTFGQSIGANVDNFAGNQAGPSSLAPIPAAIRYAGGACTTGAADTVAPGAPTELRLN